MKHLSVSKIEKYLTCPLSLKYRYIDQIPETSSFVLLAGRVVHEVVEHALRHHAKHGSYPDWQTLDDLYLPAWEKQTKEEEAKPTFLGWERNEDDPEEKIRDESRVLVRLASEEALPHFAPWLIGDDPVIEYRIDLELESEVGPFKLLGFIDLLDRSGLLADWKTAREKASGMAKAAWLQFAAYSLFVWPLIGEELVKARKVFLIRGQNPRVEYADYEIGPPHRAWFLKLAADVWKAIHFGVFPARESWACGFCSFKGPCLEGIHHDKVKENANAAITE